MKVRGILITLGVVAFGVMPAWASVPEKIGKADLHGVAPSKGASARSVVELQPRHAQVDFDRVRGLPGKPPRVFVVWLATERSRGYLAGGFRGSWAPHGFDLIVPGRESISHRNAQRAERIVVTTLSNAHGVRIFREAEDSQFKPLITIQGERVMRGAITG